MRSMKKGNPTSAFVAPEVRLLLACCRAPDAPETAGLLDAALTGLTLETAAGLGGAPSHRRIDWGTFAALTRNHGLQPLAHAHLGERTDVPQETRHRLAAESDRVARNNLVQAAILHGLVDDLTAAGAAPLVLKGQPLGAFLYGDPALRPAGDLDLLVRPADLDRAAAVLAGRGYELLEDYGPLTPRRRDALRRAGKHYHYAQPDTRSHVELHWEPVTRYGRRHPPAGFWWDGTRLEFLDGRPVPVLGLSRTLLQLAVHGGGHLWERLLWAVDVAELFRRLDTDTLEETFRLAGWLGFEAHLIVAAALATDNLETPLPRASRLLLSHATEPRNGRTILRSARGLAAARAHHTPAGTVRRLAAGAPWNGGLPATLRRTVELALMASPTDWQAIPLPDRFFPLYHLIRPLRVGLKYARGLGGECRSRRIPRSGHTGRSSSGPAGLHRPRGR